MRIMMRKIFIPRKSFPMSRKASKIMSQKAPKRKEPMSGGAKFGIVVCVLVLAGLGFAIAERLGFTGTHLLFKGEIVLAEDDESSPSAQHSRDGNDSATAKSVPSVKLRGGVPAKSSANASAQKKSGDAESSKNVASAKSSSAKKKTASQKKPAAVVPPLPLVAFEEISQRPHTWPGFVRLSRARSIAVVDPGTGASMGRMDVPAGTVVKVQRVNANGSLDVFDRTGQKFRVEASGTNFSAAYAAAKVKPKKKPKKADKPAAVAKADAPKPSVPAAVPTEKKPARSASVPAMSAFGVVIDDEEWDEAEAEE